MKVKVYTAIAAIALLAAGIAASSASFFIYYQPREPKCLKSR